MTSQSEWPDPTWHIGQPDHLHALGVITSAYNLLEFALLSFFMRYVVAEPMSAQKIFGLLSNHSILELLRESIEANETDFNAKGASLYFLKAFEILEHNRNFLSHSHAILNNPDQAHLTFGKGSRKQPNVWSFAHLTLPEIRKVADEMKEFWLYGSHVNRWLIGRGTLVFSDGHREQVTLPDKPSLPTKLKTVPHGILEE
jgi:hypothetical protein